MNVYTSVDNKQFDALYLDFMKVFNSVPHNLLIFKLKTFGINSNLLEWFNCYLNGRRQRVVVDGVASRYVNVVSGVPQGSILGPQLFLSYVNDIFNGFYNNICQSLYTHDAKIAHEIQNNEDCLILQKHIDSLLSWSKTWGMTFSVKKCKLMSIAHKRHLIDFT